MAVFKIYQTDKGYQYKLYSNQGKVVMTSETYNSKQSALDGIQHVKNEVVKDFSGSNPEELSESIVNAYSKDFENLAQR
jgi:uncharacterized protein YegP (UPF0339 family)